MKENVMNRQENTTLWSREFILICVINFLLYLSFQMLLPTLPSYAKYLGGNDTMAGMVVAIFAISAVFIRPLAGQALDLYGRKGIFISGLLFFIVIVIAFIWVPSVSVLLLMRFLHGLGWGTAATSSSTVASDLIPKSRFGEGMSYFNLTATFTMALAPPLGLYLVQHFNYQSLFLTSATLAGVTTCLAFLIGYQPVKKCRLNFAPLEKSAYPATAVIFFITMTYGAIVSFLALYGAQQGINRIGYFFTVYAFAVLITRPLVGRWSDRYGFTPIVIPGILLICGTMFLLYLTRDLTLIILSGFCYGLGYGAVLPSLQAMSVINAPPERRGAANGTFFTCFDLGVGFSSIIWGIIANHFGYRFMYLWNLVPAIIGLIIFILLELKIRTAKSSDLGY